MSILLNKHYFLKATPANAEVLNSLQPFGMLIAFSIQFKITSARKFKYSFEDI